MARNTFKEDEILETPFDFHHLLRASVYIKKYIKKICPLCKHGIADFEPISLRKRN